MCSTICIVGAKVNVRTLTSAMPAVPYPYRTDQNDEESVFRTLRHIWQGRMKSPAWNRYFPFAVVRFGKIGFRVLHDVLPLFVCSVFGFCF